MNQVVVTTYGTSSTILDYVLQHQVKKVSPTKIVDFGAGGGKNGKLIREILGSECKLTAIEGCEHTVRMLNEVNIYDEVCHDLIQNWICINSNRYDLAIFGDVLEHLTPKEIYNVLDMAFKHFDHIIVVAPLHDIFQDSIYDNPLEVHKSYITNSFFDKYKPIEKHISIDKEWTIMNIYISVNCSNEYVYKKVFMKLFHLIVITLQPFGMARPLVNCIKRFFGRYKWLINR